MDKSKTTNPKSSSSTFWFWLCLLPLILSVIFGSFTLVYSNMKHKLPQKSTSPKKQPPNNSNPGYRDQTLEFFDITYNNFSYWEGIFTQPDTFLIFSSKYFKIEIKYSSTRDRLRREFKSFYRVDSDMWGWNGSWEKYFNKKPIYHLKFTNLLYNGTNLDYWSYSENSSWEIKYEGYPPLISGHINATNIKLQANIGADNECDVLTELNGNQFPHYPNWNNNYLSFYNDFYFQIHKAFKLAPEHTILFETFYFDWVYTGYDYQIKLTEYPTWNKFKTHT